MSNNVSYTNIPIKSNPNTKVISYDVLYAKPLEIEAGVLDAMKGLFTSRGFEDSAAESVAIIIIKQARQDNYNPMEIMDTLKGLDNTEISALVAEIINYNRFKSSFLGYAKAYFPNDEVVRNIIS